MIDLQWGETNGRDLMAESAEWEIVKIVGSEEEASIVIGFLQSSGIEAEAESLHASEFPAEIGELANVNIRVPAEQAEEARAALNSREDVATGDEGTMSGEPLADSEPGSEPGSLPGSLPVGGEEPVER
jgi:hypothetical protein